MTRAASPDGAIDLSRRDLTLDIARVFCVLLVVVIHLLEVGVGRAADGSLAVSRPLEEQPWFDGVTWVGQIMPLFFVVGGFASLTAWRSLVGRGGDAAEYIRGRVIRLALPALPLYVFYVVVIGGATLVGVDPRLLAVVAKGAGLPLWFLAAYTLGQALVPLMARLHEAAPKRTLAVLLAGAVTVDALRFSLDAEPVGWLNLLFVWVLVQQTGFWYADGWFAARRWWQLVAIAALCFLALVPLTTLGPYSVNMLTNLNPPTVPLILLGLAQASILRLLRPALAALMRARPARAIAFIAGRRLMTIYLWHLPLIIVVAGIALLVPGASPAPATPAWWWTRIPVWAMVMAGLFALSLLLGRFEAPRSLGPAPPLGIAIAGAALTFVPNFLVAQFFLSLPLAIIGAVLVGSAVLLLARPGVREPRIREPRVPEPRTS